MRIDFQKVPIIVIIIIIIIIINNIIIVINDNNIIVIMVVVVIKIMIIMMMMMMIIIIIIIILITNLSRPIVHSAGFHHKRSDYSSLQEHAKDKSPCARPVHQQSSFDKHHL